MNSQPNDAKRPQKFKLLFSIIFCAVALILMVGAFIYSSWTSQQRHEAEIPKVALSSLGQSLRTFQAQTGHFPDGLRELDARIWKGKRASQISADGKNLLAASGHYYYTYHKADATSCAVWAMPVGSRYEEAATHFWYLTPTQVEKWMGPALTPENVSAVNSIPSEPQLRWLMMTQQPASQGGQGQKKAGFLFF